MKKLVDPAKITTYSADSDIKGRRVLLIGVFFGDPIPRVGLDTAPDGLKTNGKMYEENFIGFRFFDNSCKEVIDVPRGELKSFIGRNQLVNAQIRTSRPFVVTMTDGGRFQDLPALIGNKVVANRCFVVDNSFSKAPLVVNGDGQSRQMKRKTLIALREENIEKFYNC